MKKTTTVGIIAIIGLVAVANIASVAMGQEVETQVMSETEKLSAMMGELAQYGYTEVADLTADGSQVEFRSNGTITIYEDVLGNMTNTYGFELVEFAPAPALEEDSIIIVDMNRTETELVL